MRRKLLIGIGLLLSCLLAGTSMAQEFAKVGTTGAQFLKIDIGSRGAALGGVNQLLRGDVGSLFLNPAGIAWANSPQVLISHTNWLASMPYNAVAGIYPVQGVGVVGAYVGVLSSGDIEETTVDQQNGTGRMFSTSDMVAGIGLGHRLTDKFTVGGIVKYVNERLDDVKSEALSVDVGVSYDVGIKGMSLGMSIRNFGPEIRSSNTYNPFDNGQVVSQPQNYLSYQFPMTFRTGIGWDAIDEPDQQFRLGADLEHPNDNLERMHFGGEYVYDNTLAGRIGYIWRHDTATLSLGMGLMWKGMRLDYSYVDYGLLDYVQRFDFVFSF